MLRFLYGWDGYYKCGHRVAARISDPDIRREEPSQARSIQDTISHLAPTTRNQSCFRFRTKPGIQRFLLYRPCFPDYNLCLLSQRQSEYSQDYNYSANVVPMQSSSSRKGFRRKGSISFTPNTAFCNNNRWLMIVLTIAIIIIIIIVNLSEWLFSWMESGFASYLAAM